MSARCSLVLSLATLAACGGPPSNVTIGAEAGDVEVNGNTATALHGARVNFGAPLALEYHDVVQGRDGELPPGVAVSTGHVQRLVRSYSTSRHLITFDDGYTSTYTEAFPILRAARVSAVVAIITDSIADSGQPGALSTHMTRAQIATLAAAGWSIAFHARSSAEHELNWARLSLALQGGSIYGVGRPLPYVNVDAPEAADYLADNIGSAGAERDRLLAHLRAGRRAVLARMERDRVNADVACIAVMADMLRAERERLALFAGVPVAAIDTFIYPHSEANYLMTAAASRAGFVRAYAGAGRGDERTTYAKPRRWMNDASPIP